MSIDRFSYEKDYASHRPDGRTYASLASWLEHMRKNPPDLALPDDLSGDSFAVWKDKVRATLKALLVMPEKTPQPAPALLSTVQRDGYRTEKWEFYPYDTAAVPVLVQIPDTASPDAPAPVVFCFPGSFSSKEFIAGEPLPDNPAAQHAKYPERNRMGQFLVQNGMIAVTFDPIAIGETAFINEPNRYHERDELSYGLLNCGASYLGLTVFQALCFMRFCKTMPVVDPARIAVCGHSLGSEPALALTLLCGDIKALVFNDALTDQPKRYVSVTETNYWFEGKGEAPFHIVPGLFGHFSFSDLCAAAAPAYLALNEGGAEEDLNKVRRAYAAIGASDRLSVTYYPRYTDPAGRPHNDDPMPLYGLSPETYFEYTAVDAPDHSFRQEPSLRLLKRCFGLD